MYFLIGADIVPTASNFALFSEGKVKELVGNELQEILKDSSCNIINLEVPLTDIENPLRKQGSNLIAPRASVRGLKALGIDVCAIANNHIMDQGPHGLFSTMDALKEQGISFVGAGNDRSEAEKPYIFDFAEMKIGVYVCAEHEFSIAGEKTSGANPFDPLWTLDHVAALKEKVDFVIVLYHGGKESYRYPSPELQKRCRRLVDKGADLVICQHSHCVGCEEKYQGKTIVYGQGNFLFDDVDDEFWKTSLLIRIDENLSVSYLPLVKKKNGVRLAENDNGKAVLDGFATRSQEILDDSFIDKNYGEFADRYFSTYANAFLGEKSFFFRIMNKLSRKKYQAHRIKQAYDDKAAIRLVNYVECEAHRELLLRGLKDKG